MESSSSATITQEKGIECYDKQKEGAFFLLQLKENTKLQQSVIDNVVEGVTSLCNKSIEHLKKKVTELLDSEGLDDLAASERFQNLWKDELSPFKGLETLYRQEEYMKRSFPCVVCIFHFIIVLFMLEITVYTTLNDFILPYDVPTPPVMTILY